MHPSIALLDEVLILLKSEETALADEDMEAVEALSERREALLQEAWKKRAGCDENEMRERLQTIHYGNTRMIQRATKIQGQLRQRQSNGRKQAKYFNTERHIHTAMHKSFYCDVKS